MNCKYCDNNEIFYTFAPFPNPRRKTDFDPKYNFHIGMYCVKCKKFLAFAKQTPELMEKLKGSQLLNLQ